MRYYPPGMITTRDEQLYTLQAKGYGNGIPPLYAGFIALTPGLQSKAFVTSLKKNFVLTRVYPTKKI